jgi:hypothetical protein
LRNGEEEEPVTIRKTPDRHLQEDLFEQYAFNRLSEEQTADFEEHLLICEDCQAILAQTDEYIRLMKVGTATYLGKQSKILSRPLRFRHPDLRVIASIAALLVLTCISAFWSWRNPTRRPEAVTLEAYR